MFGHSLSSSSSATSSSSNSYMDGFLSLRDSQLHRLSLSVPVAHPPKSSLPVSATVETWHLPPVVVASAAVEPAPSIIAVFITIL
nr:hypothetical protein Iba_chr04bCG10770 [Ipomoea batatas]